MVERQVSRSYDKRVATPRRTRGTKEVGKEVDDRFENWEVTVTVFIHYKLIVIGIVIVICYFVESC